MSGARVRTPVRRMRRLLLATAAAVLLAACGSSEEDSGSTDTTAAAASGGGLYGGGDTEAPAETTAGTDAGTTAAAPAATGDGAVAIKDFAFNPGDASVPAGTTVTWTNEDGAAHRIQASDESFTSDDLSQGDTFEHTFDTAGTFDYICGIHPEMKGSVTVTG